MGALYTVKGVRGVDKKNNANLHLRGRRVDHNEDTPARARKCIEIDVPPAMAAPRGQSMAQPTGKECSREEGRERPARGAELAGGPTLAIPGGAAAGGAGARACGRVLTPPLKRPRFERGRVRAGGRGRPRARGHACAITCATRPYPVRRAYGAPVARYGALDTQHAYRRADLCGTEDRPVTDNEDFRGIAPFS